MSLDAATTAATTTPPESHCAMPWAVAARLSRCRAKESGAREIVAHSEAKASEILAKESMVFVKWLEPVPYSGKRIQESE